MGYQTVFKLTVVKGDKDAIAEVVSQNDDDKFYAIAHDPLGDYNEPAKWYEYDASMKELSRHFPDAVLQLDGEGEESGDIWRRFYHQGKVQECPGTVVYDAYDPKKLK